MDKNRDLITSMKSCTDYVLSLYKFNKLAPKIDEQINDVYSYCRNLEHLLKIIVKHFYQHVPNSATLQRMKKQLNELSFMNQKLVRQNKDYKIEVNVLEKKLQQSEDREKELRKKLSQANQISEEFQMKVNRIRRQSEDSLKKIIQVKREKTGLSSRKRSLPVINAHQRKQKLGLLLLIDSPQKTQRNSRLVQHLQRKY